MDYLKSLFWVTRLWSFYIVDSLSIICCMSLSSLKMIVILVWWDVSLLLNFLFLVVFILILLTYSFVDGRIRNKSEASQGQCKCQKSYSQKYRYRDAPLPVWEILLNGQINIDKRTDEHPEGVVDPEDYHWYKPD